ncbi:MAG TPA: helix-turn-helix transcriptional regulator [Fontimonas sp.]
MNAQINAAMDVEAEISVPSALVQLVHYRFGEPPHSVLRMEDKIRVELCLGTRHRSARACFEDRWHSERFERIGDLFVLPPTIDMKVRSDEESPLYSVLCHLELSPIMSLLEDVPDLSDHFLLTGLDIRDPSVRQLLLRVADETRHPGFASNVMIEALVTQIGVELLRFGGALPGRLPQRGLAEWQLKRIDERVQEARKAPTLEELAALCRLSVRQLTRGFRMARDGSLGSYVASSQMAHARALLAADESVTNIAETLGFSSSSNFCYAFRRETGMTPTQYRQTLPPHYAAASEASAVGRLRTMAAIQRTDRNSA